eukprot:SAG11_NODE_44_length_20765_cov_5.183635_2_plen_101_part_00
MICFLLARLASLRLSCLNVPRVATPQEHALGGLLDWSGNVTSGTVGGIARPADGMTALEKLGRPHVWPMFLFLLSLLIVTLSRSVSEVYALSQGTPLLDC